MRRLFTLTALSAMLAVASLSGAEPKKNLLGVTTDVRAWTLEEIEDAGGMMKPEDDAMLFTIAKIDGIDWHLQAYQVGIDLREGGQYVVSFKARASAKRVTQLYVGVNEDDFHPVGVDELIDLGPDWRSFAFTFRARDVAQKNNRVGFVLGHEKGSIWIKDLTLTPK